MSSTSSLERGSATDPAASTEPQAEAGQRSSWIPALAGYRALAALAVFGFHIASIEPPEGPWGEWTLPLGSAAVSLFFALSGFLIYRPFAWWAFGRGKPIKAGPFILRRAVRILPLYWTVLTIHLFVFGRGGANSLGDYLTAYALIQNFRGSLVFIPPFVAWSLCIELWFSVSLPTIAWILRRVGHGRSLKQRLFIQLFGFGWLAGLATVFRIWALSQERGGGQLLWFPGYLDWFSAGIILATLSTYWQIRVPPVTIRRLAANPALTAFLGLMSYWVITKIGVPGGFVPTTAFQTHSQFSLQAVMSFFLLAAAVLPNSNLGVAGRLLASRPLAWVGSLSYGIYLIHPVVIDEILARQEMARPVLALMALTLTTTSAFLIHHLVERPAAQLIDRALGVRSAQSTMSPPVAQPAAPQERLPRQGTPTSSKQISSPINRLGVLAFATGALATVLTLLARPGIYVADARYELFADPAARLSRSLTVWDPSRDIGRAAEEFWPGLVLFSTLIHSLGLPEWANQRLLHAALLTLGATGAMVLSKTLGREAFSTTVIAGVIYGFGPFSALYLVPSPLYVSYAIAPWVVIAVIRAGRNQAPLRWAGIASLLIFLAGNADPPGLVFALVPAFITWLALMGGRPQTRRPLAAFTLSTIVATGLASSAMLVKTTAGAAALSHRLSETESAQAVAAHSSFAESLRGMGFWLSYLELGPTIFRDQGRLFLDSWAMVLLTFVPLIVGIAALARRRQSTDLLSLAWLVAAVVLMAGPHPVTNPSPYGRFLLRVYDMSDVAFGFRSTHKAGVGLALATAMLAASGFTTLIGWTQTRLRSSRGLPTIGVAIILLALSQPFWRTDLYDPALVSAELPEHWQETAHWFEQHPPEGRVLVLPGTTNNGYRWGSVGDDLLDPIIPGRVVASTLPLSTPLSADLIQRMDEVLTSSSYEAGTLLPLAQRLGISHIVIRNDLDWSVQGVTRPGELEPLRADPDLNIVASFGPQGLFSSSPDDPGANFTQTEQKLPAVQVYEVNQATRPAGLLVLPDGDHPRQILLSGDASGLVSAASHGLLDGGHPVRYSAGLDQGELLDMATDTALIVITDSNTQRDRKINYYGYDEIPLLTNQASASTTNNHWLPADFPEQAAATATRLEGAQVSSSIDPWLLGATHQPAAALDDDPSTSWFIPFFASGEPQSWSVQFVSPNSSSGVNIAFSDKAERASNLEVWLDGDVVQFDRTSLGLVVHPSTPFTKLQIHFDPLGPGFDPVAIREVTFSDVQPRLITSVPVDLGQQIASNPVLGQQLAETPLSIILDGGPGFETNLVREVQLWRDDVFTLDANVLSTSPDTSCTKQMLTVDGSPVAVQFTPNGDGTGRLNLCPSADLLRLNAGTHEIQFRLEPGYLISSIRFDSGQPRPHAVVRTLLPSIDASQNNTNENSLSQRFSVSEGDLILAGTAFDSAWTLGSNAQTKPLALDTLNAWSISADQLIDAPSYQPESGLRLALILSMLGVILSGAMFLIPAKRLAVVVPTSTSTSVSTAKQRMQAKPALLPSSFKSSVVLGAAFFFLGPYGLLGTAMGWIIHRFRPAVSLFTVASVGLIGVAILSAAPLLDPAVSLVRTGGDASLARVVVGLLLAALVTNLDQPSNFSDAAG